MLDKLELGWISQKVLEVLPDAVHPTGKEEMLFVNEEAILATSVRLRTNENPKRLEMKQDCPILGLGFRSPETSLAFP